MANDSSQNLVLVDSAVEWELASREAQSVCDLNANSASRAGAGCVLAQRVLANARHGG